MTDAYSSHKSVTRWDIFARDLPAQVLAAPEGSRLFLLPDKTLDGVGIYRDDAIGLVKTLRHHGIDIDYASPRQDRRYLSEYGAADVAAVIALAVAGNLTGDLIKSVVLAVRHRVRSATGAGSAPEEIDSANVTVRIAEIVRSDQETVVRGLEVTSSVAGIESLIRGAISDRSPSQPSLPDASGPEDAPE